METSAANVEKDKERASDIVSSAVSTEVTGMRRDHESIDDFEHLEPESSPLSETPGKHSFDINTDLKSTVNSGSATIVGKVENNQNSSEFSLLGDSKVGSVEAGNTPETLEEIPPTEFSNKLIDFEAHDEQTKVDSKLNIEPEKSLFATTETNKQAPEYMFDLPTQKGSGLDLFNRFEISPKGSDASAMSQAFMEMERGGMREEKNAKIEDILQPEVQNIESKTDELPKQKIEEKKPSEPEFHPAFAHLKDEAHDDDSFKDTDSIPEQIKAEEKFKDFPEEIQPSNKDFGFPEPNVHGDFHPPEPAAKGTEDSSVIDRLEDKKAKEETKPRADDSVTKHDLELGIPTQLTGKQIEEEKSPTKTKPEVVKPTIKAEAKKSPAKVDDEPVIAPFALASIGLAEDCRDRWKNLRGSCSRHLRSASDRSDPPVKIRKPNYLAEYMLFLKRLTKSRKMKDCNSNTDMMCISPERKQEAVRENIGSSCDCGVVARYGHGSPSRYNSLSSPVKNCTSSTSEPKRCRKLCTSDTISLADVDKSAYEYFQPKNKYENTTYTGDPDFAFFISILPDMKEMSGEQKRRFKIGVINLAGQIVKEET